MASMWLLTLVSGGVATFMLNRLYVGLSQKQLTVKGILYSRLHTPVQYWTTMVVAAFDFCFLAFVCLASTGALG